MTAGQLGRPTHPWWGPTVSNQYLDVNGVTLRFIEFGRGPDLVLLHTLRTQLDIFHPVIAQLSEQFRIHAVDYPGHGYSDIPQAEYTPDFLAEAVGQFLTARGLTGATVAGVSIGASIALMLAARHHPAVGRVVAINPYDYRGGGVERGNLVARSVMTMLKSPRLGPVAMRLNNRAVERKLLKGGVVYPPKMAKMFSDEVFAVGNRAGYSQMFLNLVSHFDLWNEIKSDYANIAVPVLLIYGDKDWASQSERADTAAHIPTPAVKTVGDGGHFLPLDQPAEVVRLISNFASPAS